MVSDTSIEKAEMLRQAHPDVIDSYFYDDAGQVVLNIAPGAASRMLDLGGFRTRAVQFTQARLEQVNNNLPKEVRGELAEVFKAAGINNSIDRVVVFVDPSGLEIAKKALSEYPEILVEPDASTHVPAITSIGGWSQNGCTSGFDAVYRAATVQLTAGHCTLPLGATRSNGSGTLGVTISSHWQDGGSDWGLIDYNTNVSTPPQVANRQGGTITITGFRGAVYGETMCKQGVKTGTTCGRVKITQTQAVIEDSSGTKRTIRNLIGTSICTQTGDSGGPLVRGNAAVGIVSTTQHGITCGYNSLYSSEGSGVLSYHASVAHALAAYDATLKTG